MFYGVSGPASSSFQGGTLCVKSQVKRTPAVSSGGNPPPNDCSGVYAIDMNLFAAGGLGGTPLAALTVAGTLVEVAIPERRMPVPNPVHSEVQFSDAQALAVHAMRAAAPAPSG